ncbi:MAG TPA: RHS repeat-associated core domain-containing protein [Verrucomicrobiae bacterium]|nr:RHS repeat-associated core domain-containing protein [Verrucomicrobiae bacterium]
MKSKHMEPDYNFQSREFNVRQPLPLRLLTWLIVATQVMLPNGYVMAAAQSRIASLAMNSLSANTDGLTERGLRRVTSRDQAVFKAAMPATTIVTPEFSSTPEDSEFFAISVLPEPLSPIGGRTTIEENQDLAEALIKFHERSRLDDFSAITDFVGAHPKSPWRIALWTNLGLLYRKAGYFSRAMQAWENAWNAGKHFQSDDARAVVNRALGQLADLNARLGRKEQLLALFDEIEGRPISGPATEDIAGAREGLWGMNHQPGQSFLCGPLAVRRLFRILNPKSEVPECFRSAESTTNGTSLSQLHDMSIEAGFPCEMVQRSPEAEVPVPSVIHWKSGHFAALVAFKNGRYFVKDTTFGTDIWVTKAAIEDEGSGYFLVPRDRLTAGLKPIDSRIGDTIWGKGRSNNGDKRETRPTDMKQGCPPLGGMAGYSVHKLLVSLNIVDTPLSYTPPFGPSLDFTVTYNQREAGQSSSFNYPNLGPKWSFNWLAYITEITPNQSTSGAEYHTPGGGYETYDDPDAQGIYPIQPKTRSKLQRNIDGSGNTIGYQLMFADGSKAIFTFSDGAVGSRKWFMTQYLDSFGNALNFNFAVSSGNILLQTVTCATATATLSYSSSDPFKITQVTIATTASGSRSAKFSYSAGELSTITDAEGMVSRFGYDSTITDFINTLTTPYGQTSFSYLPYPGYTAPSGSPDLFDRWLVITDPMGQQERFVYKIENTEIPKSENPTPAGMTIFSDATSGQYLQYRNTFYWDKKAMQSVADPNHPDWSKATVWHWLHLGNETENGSLIAAGVLESEKLPLERRVWYSYPDQTDNRFLPNTASGITSPVKIARVLDNGETQTYQYTYNDLGKVTSFIDPLGRRTSFIFDSNNLIDLLEVHQTTPGYGDQLLTKVTYNSGHLPITVQDVAGQKSSFSYNARGQLTQIVDAKNAVTTFNYDATTGFLQTIVRPDISGVTTAQRTSTITPDSFFRAQTITDGDGYSLTFNYDNLDRLTQTTFPDSTTEKIVYQKLNASLFKDRLDRWTAIEYDALGRAVIMRDAQLRTTRFDYCTCGELTSITDPNGATTSWIRDLQGRVQTKIFPDNSQVNYAYEDYTSRLKSITDALGQKTTFSYFRDNNLSEISYTDCRVPTPSVAFTYDLQFNRLATMIDGNGITAYSYYPISSLSSPPTSSELWSAKGAAQLKAIDGPWKNDLVTFSYDELGRVAQRTVNNVTEKLAYDALGRLTAAQNPLDNFIYSYENASGRLKSINRLAGSIASFTYFSNGDLQNQQLLQTILNKVSGGSSLSQFDYDYTSDGQIKDWTRKNDGNPATATFYGFGYDSVNQLLSAVLKNGNPMSPGTLVKEFGYGYDGNGNRLTEYSSSPTVSTATEKFNNLNQLTARTAGERVNFVGSASDPSTPINVTIGGVPATMSGNNFNGYGIASVDSNVVEVAAQDSAGNKLAKRYQVNSIVASGANKTLTYDLNGNLVAVVSGATTDTYEWDGANRLTAVERVTSGARVSRSEFSYDGLGRRVKIVEKNGTGATTSTKLFLWCGSELCQEQNSGGTITKEFFSQGEVRGASKYFYTRDHLGSIREVVDYSGNILARYDYDPYGARTKVTGTFDCDFGFCGYYVHEPSGLFLTLFRAYGSDTGRWLNRDPIGELGGLNLYNYVYNNPVNFIDPYGLFQTGMFVRGAIGAVVSGVGAVVGYAAATTGVGTIPGGALGIYSSYQFGANVGNMINAFGDGPAGPAGPAEAAATLATDNPNVQKCGQIADLAIPLALSFGASPQWSRLPTTALGRPGTIAGAVQRVPGDPNVVYPFLQAFQYADAAITVYEGWNWVGPSSTTQVNQPPAQVVGPRP